MAHDGLSTILLVLTRQPEGGYTVMSPQLPELVTEGDTLHDALRHADDALQAVVELYEDLGKPSPVMHVWRTLALMGCIAWACLRHPCTPSSLPREKP